MLLTGSNSWSLALAGLPRAGADVESREWLRPAHE